MLLEKRPEYSDADLDQMRQVQQAVVRALLPFRDTTPAHLLVLACITPARTLLRTLPRAQQQGMLDAVLPFLEGKATPRGMTESGIILPDGVEP